MNTKMGIIEMSRIAKYEVRREARDLGIDIGKNDARDVAVLRRSACALAGAHRIAR